MFGCAFLVSAAIALAGPPSGMIQGTLVDGQGRPVPGASVLLLSEGSPQRQWETRTNLAGEFQFSHLRVARYRIVGIEDGVGVRVDTEVGRGFSAVVALVVPAETDVDVDGDTPTVDASGASRTTVMNSDFLSRIPTGRAFGVLHSPPACTHTRPAPSSGTMFSPATPRADQSAAPDDPCFIVNGALDEAVAVESPSGADAYASIPGVTPTMFAGTPNADVNVMVDGATVDREGFLSR